MIPPDFPQFFLSGAPALYCAGMLLGFDALLQRRGAAKDKSQPHLVTAPLKHAAPLFSARTRGMRVSVADSPEALQDALRLVRNRYEWRGYETNHVTVDSHGGSSRTHEITLLAQRDDEALGTVTLRLDSPVGLTAEEGYGDAVAAARAKGRRVCELTRLALAESSDSKPVLASLFSLGYAVGRTIHGVTDVFIEVNPRHVGFYQRSLGFAVGAGERFCERVKAPSVLLQLELADLERRLRLTAPQPAAGGGWSPAFQPT